MNQRQKRLVYVGLAFLILVLFAGGLVYGYPRRHTPICKDGRLPVQQEDTGIGQVAYRCPDGTIIVK